MVIKMVLAFAASLIVILLLMPLFIKYLQKINYNQTVSEYSLDAYKEKQKTPTMGGVLFVIVPVFVALIFGENVFDDLNVAVVIFAYMGYALIGFIDDYIIVIKKDNAGLKPLHKLVLQVVLSIVFYAMYASNAQPLVHIPLFNIDVNLGIFYSLFVFFMFTAESNAVNITDGMDGLVGGLMSIALVPFLILALIQGEANLSIFIIAVIGALVGYLYFNVNPAKIFMGDTGALALGGLLASIAMVLKEEVALVFIGGIFVIEILCVIIQIGSVKLRGKRVFKYTPIHYSFVLDGMKEKTVVKKFWIVGFFFAVIGLLVGLL